MGPLPTDSNSFEVSPTFMIRIPLLQKVHTVLAFLAVTACQNAIAQVDFAHDVFPLFKSQCSKCHGGDESEGGFSLNSRESLLKGADSGPAVVVGKSRSSLLYEVITTSDPDKRMPPEGERLTEVQIKKIANWIDEGVAWEPGLSLAKDTYEPPLLPRRPDLPKATPGFEHPIDRLLQSSSNGTDITISALKDDSQFARRLSLDISGILPEQDWLAEFLKDGSSDKRTKLIRTLLADKRNYAEHWLTFWNDILRNDYGGTGFITGGRKQISQWLYKSLIDNKPYDQMARELISPTPDSAGFSEGIRWRGTVSAGQTVEIQFSQSVGQSFLGINLKCASCHDSFIDRWKLDDAYGLAAIFSKTPLDVHRCDKPTGKQAKPAWLFPELGTIDPELSQPERLRQLAGLMTHPQNGRFSRTIVNRLWHRLMGRGIVEPVDSMQSRPWNEDLLDWLAVDFAEHGFDLKHTIELICTSRAYQSQVEVVLDSQNQADYVYRGPRGKRMTAEQFVDCVWQLCDAAPSDFDAPVLRGEMTPEQLSQTEQLRGKWIWSNADSEHASSKDKASFQRSLDLEKVPERAAVVASCDNSFELFINKKKVLSSDNWESIRATSITKYLKKGTNEFLLSCKNAGDGPNPAGVFLEARWLDEKGKEHYFHTDANWQTSEQLPGKNGEFKGEVSWTAAALASKPEIWMNRIGKELRSQLGLGMQSQNWMVRAGLRKSDALQRTLGRPNRDQIVTSRPTAWSTLEALDLCNAPALDKYLMHGAEEYENKGMASADLVDTVFLRALSRKPTVDEKSIAIEMLGNGKPTADRIQDFLWTVVMLPEFQIVR